MSNARWRLAEKAAGHSLCPCRTGTPHEAGAAVPLDSFTSGADMTLCWRPLAKCHIEAGGQITYMDFECRPRFDLMVANLMLPGLSEPLKPGVPCSHPGCLSHVSHPCEGCGRIAGR